VRIIDVYLAASYDTDVLDVKKDVERWRML
jgi:hypothetical protein